MLQLIIGFILGGLIGVLAWRAKALSASGALAATCTGGLIFGLGSLPWAILLLAFFISSSFLSRVFAKRKANLSEKFAKSSRRDWGQVLANGGLGALLACAQAVLPDASWPWIAYAGALAAVNADTWATELGVFSSRQPRLITSGKPVERGASGGITLVGYLASLGGASLIAILAGPFSINYDVWVLMGVIILGGLLGASVDSWLGATYQAIYYCPTCQKETERHPTHTCETDTYQIRGWRWLNNDWVNFICSLVGAITTLGLYALIA